MFSGLVFCRRPVGFAGEGLPHVTGDCFVDELHGPVTKSHVQAPRVKAEGSAVRVRRVVYVRLA